MGYRRVSSGPRYFEISKPKGPQLSGDRYFWVVKIHEKLKKKNDGKHNLGISM